MGSYFADPQPGYAARSAAPSRHPSGKLLRLDAEFAEACRQSDRDWLQHHLAEDFRGVGHDGTLASRAEFIARCGDAARATLALRDAEVQFEGDTAIVRSIAMTASGQERALDIWIGRDGRWQLLTSQRTAIAAPAAVR